MSARLVNTANIIIEEEIKKDAIEAQKLKVIKNIAKNIKIDGFRKGKVPNSIVESRFKDRIEVDSEQAALSEVIKGALDSLKIEPKSVIGNPVFSKFERKDGNISVEIKMGLFPLFDLGDYEKLIPEVKLDKIKQSEIDERLENIRAQFGELVDSQKESVENGDVANVNFEGFLNGEAFNGGKAQDYNLEIGSKSFIEGFEEKVIGMKKGEEKTINLTFPKDYGAADLAGKDVEFKVKLNAIKTRNPHELNDELAKLALPNNKEAKLDDLKASVREQLNSEAKYRAFNDLKPKLADNLIDNLNFDLPENIIEQEVDILFRNYLSGLPAEVLKEFQEDKKKAEDKRASFKDDARKSVKLTFIIDKISKKNKISVSDNELYQTLYYEAMMSSQNPKELIEAYEKNNMLPVVKMTILENKVLSALLESKISESSAESEKNTESSALKTESKNESAPKSSAKTK